MANPRVSNEVVVTNNGKRISAMKKYVTNGKTEIPVGGEVLKPPQVIAVFQDSLDKRAAVTATQASYRSALADRIAAEEKLRVTDEALKGWVLNRFGVDSAEAREFGYAPRKVGTVTVAKRARAILLNQATRAARGTVGKKKKLEIKGTLVAPTAPAAPAIVSAPPAVAHVSVAPAAAPVVNAPGAAPVAAAPAAVPAVNAPAAGGSA